MSNNVWGELPGLFASEFSIFQPEVNYSEGLDLLCEKLETTIPENSVLLGWSLGGMLAVHLAAKYPQKIQSLITLATNAQFVADDDWPAGLSHNLFDGFQRLVNNSPKKSLPYFNKLVVKNDSNSQKQLKFLAYCNEAYGEVELSKEHLSSGLDLLQSINNQDKYREIGCPTLHVFGESDELVPAIAAESIQQLNSQHKVVSIENAGHCLHYPTQHLLPVINNFLQKSLTDKKPLADISTNQEGYIHDAS